MLGDILEGLFAVICFIITAILTVGAWAFLLLAGVIVVVVSLLLCVLALPFILVIGLVAAFLD